ncbi:PREDICTED: EF-hand calcium-binding domain-containing protein 3, partial [Gekko japonicus]|uniref:EF-hand calcium-binding domain-containing protein 3 n=1 Tax=Gekko japonicus TaxID=146911 RepID=A0ABM1L690_GEKJA
TTTPSDSPYAQIPIFPLIPNRDCVMAGKPKKDIHKLAALRSMEPVTSFEDHFFHKRRWLPESKASKAPRPSLSLAPELTSKGRRLTIHNLDEIRREVKKATENYRKALALRERNKSLKLWRRLRGGEIGLESGNPSFYQTFSTYSWSWNVCKELLTPQELQEYDNQLYHSSSRSASPVDRMIKVDGKQRGSKK